MCLATEHLWKANPHVCPPADLMAAIKLQAQPRGFSLGAFGMTVFGGAGIARGSEEPCGIWIPGGCSRLSWDVSCSISDHRVMGTAPFCLFCGLSSSRSDAPGRRWAGAAVGAA